MSTLSDTATDPIAQAIADAVIARLNQQPAAGQPPVTDLDLDIPYPVTLICDQLGKRGRPMSHQTFQKRFLESGLLRLINNPNDRRSRYVRLGDWLKLKKETR